MMGGIGPNVREGLHETFDGVLYEKNPGKVLQAMIQMGVLSSYWRYGSFSAFINLRNIIIVSFEERLAAQKREREMATSELGFKKQLSREEIFEKKRQ
ncbi:putative ABC-type Cd(2+) transporter [Dioscorea sansibarensis]